MTQTPKRYVKYFIFFICFPFLFACTSKKQQSILEHVQNEYKNIVNLNERYMHNFYGKADPASFERLKRYRYEAYQSIINLRSRYDKTKPLPQAEIQESKKRLDIYRSYLNALGATSATKDNLLGF